MSRQHKLLKRTPELPDQPKPGDAKTVAINGNTKLELVWIPPGVFMMGGRKDEEEQSSVEEPQHQVRIGHGFWMGKYLVTQRQWVALMGENPARYRGFHRPVENVSWHDCQEFLLRLNGQLGGDGVRLPSEAEWEYACRAQTTTPFSFGKKITTRQVNCSECALPWINRSIMKRILMLPREPEPINRGYTTPVDHFPPNGWGLHDMHGNVCEWCEDDWHDTYTDAPSDGRAWVDVKRRTHRPVRGGCSISPTWGCRSAYRMGFSPRARFQFLGFRVVQTEAPESTCLA